MSVSNDLRSKPESNTMHTITRSTAHGIEPHGVETPTRQSADTTTGPSLDFKDTPMLTIDIPSLDLIAREAELIGREPLAPDSPRPPGRDESVDESLAARTPSRAAPTATAR